MKKIVELSSTDHKDLKLDAQAAIQIAAKQQTLNIRISEVAQCAANFPVFFMSNVATGNWALSGLTSFVPNSNLFLSEEKWLATYLPIMVQTYPFFLVNSSTEEKGFTIGIDEDSEALSKEHGEPIFSGENKASMHLSQVTSMLEADIKNTVHTAQFIELIEKLELMKAVDMIVYFNDGTAQNMTGLHTIDEDKLQLLSAQTLEELNKKGYLVQIHAMLISLYQINSLIQKNNAVDGLDKIRQVKFETTKDKSTI